MRVRIGTLLLVLLAVFAGFLSAEDEVLTKAFVIKFRKVDEVASIVNGLLSDRGAITLQPRLRTVVVQDTEKNLRQVEMAIAAFDVPPPAVELSVKLVRATKNPEVTPIAEEIKSMAKVSEVLKFNQYALLDSGLLQCEEGEKTALTLAKDYLLGFTADVIQEGNGIIRLKDFQLRRRKKDSEGKDVYVPLISVTINLRNGETLVLGASRFEESNQALMLILLGNVKKNVE